MNRKQSKLLFIRRKNRIMDPERGYKGIFHTSHVWMGLITWLDFSFFSKRFKGQYYAVAMCTLEDYQIGKNDEFASDLADKEAPLAEYDPYAWIPEVDAATAAKYQKLLGRKYDPEKAEAYRVSYEAWIKAKEKAQAHLNALPYKVAPFARYFKHQRYTPSSMGIEAVVDCRDITPEIIVAWIERFYAAGEPQENSDGWLWTDEPVDVHPQALLDAWEQCKDEGWSEIL